MIFFKKLFSSNSSSDSDYKIKDSLIWENFNVKKIETKHKIIERAKIDGSNNMPPTNSTQHSECELEIKLEYEQYLERITKTARHFFEKLEEKLNYLNTYFDQDHFKPALTETRSKILNIITQTKLSLNDRKNYYNLYKQDLDQFKRIHQLSREAEYSTLSSTRVTVILLSILFLIEIGLNSSILGEALIGGQAQGLAVSTAFAGLNVLVSFFTGYYLFKNLNHNDKVRRVIFSLCGLAYIFFIFFLNWCLGAFRSAGEGVIAKEVDAHKLKVIISEIERHRLLDVASKPWNQEISVLGLVLVFLGVSFAVGSILKGYFYNDIYPDYGSVAKKANIQKYKVRLLIHNLAKKSSEIFTATSNQLHDVKKEILDLANDWNYNTNILEKEFITYEDKLNLLEQNISHIIKEYRERNKSIRTTPAPNYFAEEFIINKNVKDPILIFREIKFHYNNDENRTLKYKEISSKIEKIFENSLSELKKNEEEFIILQEKINLEYANL
jgi:hypothetical protein